MIANTVKFWTYIVLLIPSIICLLFILFHLLFNRTLRSSLNNHGIILLLIITFITEVTIYPWMLYFYQFKGTWRRAQIFCAIWGYLDWGLYVTQTILFAWITIERHILIFHDRWISTRKKRLFLHYLPLILLLLYGLIFYLIVYFFPPCRNYFSNSSMLCLDPCLIYNYIFSMWEMIVHQLLPAFIIIVFSIALFVRVLWQKHRIHQPVQWRKHRKMAIQVLSISLLYIAFFFPYTIYNLMLTFNVSSRLIRTFGDYSEFLAFFITPLLPFVCISALPELQSKLFSLLHLKRNVRRTRPGPFSVKLTTKNRSHHQET